MDYSKELLQKIEEEAKRLMTPSEISALLGIDESEFIDDINTLGHPARIAFFHGVAVTAREIREDIRDAARAGSPFSVSECLSLMPDGTAALFCDNDIDMSLPINIDEYSKLVVLDDNELQQQNVAVSIRERLQRLRGIYAYWLQFPSKFDKEIVDYDMKKFKVGRAQAYDDLHLTQILMGNLQQASKEFMRWKINRDLEEDLRMARQRGDLRAVASIEKNRIMNNRTDKDDEPELEFDKIVPQQFEMTDDPTVIGIQKVPGLRDRIRKLEKKYGDTKIEDADYEEIKEEHDGNGTDS